MNGETSPSEGADDDPSDSPERSAVRDTVDGQLVSDLSVNAIPIGIILAFTAVVVVFSPTDEVGGSVLLFHGALIGGVVLVSGVAGWTIRRLGAPLEGSAARSYDADSNHESDGE